MNAISRSDIELAHRLAALAASVATSDARPRSWLKQDGSVVTETDLAVDAALIEVLRAARPNDALLSEESGSVTGVGGRRWIIDPVDGTSSLVDGLPSWGTHIALAIDDLVQIAIITRPVLGVCWWAVSGHGAYRSGIGDHAQSERVRVSEVDDLSQARVSGMVEPGSREAALLAERGVWTPDDVCAIGALAEGRLDVVLDDAGYAWDQAPATLLVSEAGGRSRDPLGGGRFDLGWGLYSNAGLYSELLDLLPILGG